MTVGEASSLEDFIAAVCPESHLRVEADLGDGFVRLRTEEAERRQAIQDIRSNEDVVIELLRNSRDAGATEIYLATHREGDVRRITVVDDGCGVPAHLHEAVFEPRVTSKLDAMRMDEWGVHGRGMALYSIRENADDARILASAPGLGCALRVRTRAERLKEKADQSSFPAFVVVDGVLKVTGPRNILRTACEFAFQSRKECTVYLGSSTEVAAALYRNARGRTRPAERAFADAADAAPLCSRLASCADPDAFSAAAASLGLELSPRSARRILDGQIAAPRDLTSQVVESIAGGLQPDRAGDARADARRGASRPHGAGAKGLKLQDADRDELAAAVHAAYRSLAGKYYLDPESAPTVRTGRDGIRIHIPFVPMD